MTTKLPFFPLVNTGSNLVQPVYVVDVAKAIFEIIKVRLNFFIFALLTVLLEPGTLPWTNFRICGPG